jgi:hypothetical protein
MSDDGTMFAWRHFSTVERAFAVGMAVLVLIGAGFAIRQVSRSDPPPLPPLTDSAQVHPIALGYLVSATDTKIVIQLGNRTKRSFVVRPADLPHVGVEYLDAHRGSRSVGFLIYYETVGGIDYALGAVETNPPPLGGG